MKRKKILLFSPYVLTLWLGLLGQFSLHRFIDHCEVEQIHQCGFSHEFNSADQRDSSGEEVKTEIEAECTICELLGQIGQFANANWQLQSIVSFSNQKKDITDQLLKDMVVKATDNRGPPDLI